MKEFLDPRLQEFSNEQEKPETRLARMKKIMGTAIMLGLIKVLEPLINNFVQNEQQIGRRFFGKK